MLNMVSAPINFSKKKLEQKQKKKKEKENSFLSVRLQRRREENLKSLEQFKVSKRTKYVRQSLGQEQICVQIFPKE